MKSIIDENKKRQVQQRKNTGDNKTRRDKEEPRRKVHSKIHSKWFNSNSKENYFDEQRDC